MSTTRRQVLKFGLAGGAGIVGYSLLGNGWTAQGATATAQLKSFVQPLQVPPVIDKTGGGSYLLTARQVTRQLHPALPATNVFTYDSADAQGAYSSYLGPTVVVKKGVPVTASYANGLPASYGASLPCDLNLTMRMGPGTPNDKVRLLTHLHGGFVHGQMDGNPAVDMGYLNGETQTVWYGNEQRGSLIWYHDHGMGTTRLNVWAGLAGAYVVRDDKDTGDDTNAYGLPYGYGTGPGSYEVPLVFQDRQFLASGAMLYPSFPQNGVMGSWGMAGGGLTGSDPGMENVYGNTNGPWIGEAFGDEGLVNGLVAPFHNVEPRLYRFRCLNGCNARILDLQLAGGLVGGGKAPAPPPMYVIGADGGLLAAPVKVKTLTMMPGERLDVLIDFTGYTGKVQLKNTNLDGFYTSPAPRLVDFLQFNIVPPVPGQSHTRNNTVPQSLDLVDGTAKLTSSGTVRTINMFEMNANALHWWMGLLGTGGGANDVNVPAGGFADLITPAWNANTFHQPIGERPQQGAVQDWDFINNTADSHPMHIHLVQFQVVHRRAVGAAAIPPDGTLVSPWETGWNDTISVHPGQVTRVRVKFDLPPPTPAGTPDPANFTPAGVSDKYDLDTTTGEARRCFVYHCHILEHEENDMMRPFLVT